MPPDFLTICHTALTAHGSLYATLFLGGLAGGVTHCAGMCGPFVLNQTAMLLDEQPLRQLSEWQRARGAALVPYHAGRMTTYAALGAGAALFSAQFRHQPWFHYFAAASLAIAGLIFLISAIPLLRPIFPSLDISLPDKGLSAMRFLFARPSGWRGYLLGLILGLLPCGLVYAAIFSVAARGEPLTAVVGMILFSLGTVPALTIVGIGGHFAFRKYRSALRYLFPVLMLMNSLTLLAMAGDLAK